MDRAINKEPKKKEDARYLSDKATFENKDFSSYCMKNFKGYPEELSEKGLTFYRVIQENYKRWIDEEKIKTVTLVEEYTTSQQIIECLEKGKLWDKIVLDELNKKHVGDFKSKEIIFLCCIGRKLIDKKPYAFNNIILSQSSAGKDHLVSSVLKLFPRDEYETYSRISPKALNYLHTIEQDEDYTYDGKILYLKEITEEVLNNEVMKEFTASEDEICEIAITKQKGLGIDIKQVRGHPVVITTTATTTPTPEIRNRFSIIGIDESEEQTKRTRINNSNEYSEEIKSFIANLKSFQVEIPQDIFKFVSKNFPSDRVRYRRDFPKFLDFIKAITLFNQEIRNCRYNILRAEPEDYNLAKDIFINSYTKLSDIPLQEVDKRIIKALKKADKPLSVREICEYLDGFIAIQNIYPHMNDLKFKEMIIEITDREGFKPTTKYILSEDYKDDKPFKLPTYEEDSN